MELSPLAHRDEVELAPPQDSGFALILFVVLFVCFLFATLMLAGWSFFDCLM